MKDFTIRSYGRTELALLYNPHLTPQSAWRTLNHWIGLSEALSARLRQLGYNSSSRRFTPAMVAAIVAHLGEP